MPAPLLVLTDFTPAADAALRYAAALAAVLHVPLVLLHVNRNSVFDPETFTGKIPHRSEGEIAVALNERVQNMPVPVIPALTAGRSTRAIREVVEQHRPALLILGRPSVAELPDELVSTTSLDLLAELQYPLLIVPAGTAPQVPQRIALAADGNPFQLAAPARAVPEVLGTLRAAVTVVHVAEPEDDDSCRPSLVSVQQAGLLTDGQNPVSTHGTRHLDVPRGIEQAMQATRAELLVLIARRHNVLGRLFHRSVTAQMIRQAQLPVLVLPTTG
ncbi:universal stress protein [Hymenobacter chitinivorans]|uniref:Universal stress protein family protein n=1 Tax=Hymenobacter chitinivorans DSM 11115 TaxID=1121954 RepID=A0A2M9BN76_9BACT|nr:universal stress protein [Hymenobacter chitinivorans]PJJ59385.1 universal stress protein family protein [Hymenobacter chitinivorans DSM 11115]